MTKPRLLIIIASTRPGRVGLPVGQWFHERATSHGGFEVEVADLAEWNLPFMDEPNHPRLRQYTQPHTQRWSATVDRADGFVFVMPEYNNGFNAPLKNAIDYLYQEWQYKPVGFVSYGGTSGGLRAVQMAKLVVTVEWCRSSRPSRSRSWHRASWTGSFSRTRRWSGLRRACSTNCSASSWRYGRCELPPSRRRPEAGAILLAPPCSLAAGHPEASMSLAAHQRTDGKPSSSWEPHEPA
jgi:NAD(P)H-dependent FMN reductase